MFIIGPQRTYVQQTYHYDRPLPATTISIAFFKNAKLIAMNTSDPKKPNASRFPVQKIPPSHDYIRQHGSGPKDGWTKGPGDPVLGPGARDGQPAGSIPPQTPDGPPSNSPQTAPRPLYGDIHKFGYTRPLKKHEEMAFAREAPPAPSPPFVEIGDEDDCALYFTSGTTGAPKAVLHAHRSLMVAAITEATNHCWTSRDAFLKSLIDSLSSPVQMSMITVSYASPRAAS